MGFLDLEATGVRSAESPNESKRFGTKTVRVTAGLKALESPDESIAQVLEILDQPGARLAIIRYPTRFTGLAGSLGMRDEHLFPSGSLLYWEATDSRRPAQEQPAGLEVFDVAHGSGVSEARRVIADSFAGYLTHYSSNPGLDSNLVSEGYVEWAVSSLARPFNKLFVLRDRGVPSGAAVVAVTGDTWEIELAGISTAAQGKGHYSVLLGAVMEASRLAQSRLIISTQAHNTRVQRLWAKLDFVPFNSFDTVHLVRSKG